MSDLKMSKRNYIRRKKYLNDCIAHIKATLEFIHLARGEKMDPTDSQKQAMANAQAIEAVCWSPHSRLSADGYQKLMLAKTQELCRTIIKKSLPSVDLVQLQKLTAALLNERAHTPQPTLPVPIIPQVNNNKDSSVSISSSSPDINESTVIETATSTTTITHLNTANIIKENKSKAENIKSTTTKSKTSSEAPSHLPLMSFSLPSIPFIQSFIKEEDFLQDNELNTDRYSFVPSFELLGDDISETSPFLQMDNNNENFLENAMMRLNQCDEYTDFPFAVC